MNTESEVAETEVAAADTNSAEPSEKEVKQVLMQRARMMGITFSNNISVEGLRAKINAKLDDEPVPVDESDEPAPDASAPDAPAQPEAAGQINPLTGLAANAPKKDLRQQLIEENMRLVRLRITNMDPRKRDLPGEIITIANEYIGTVRKFVPYGEATENGFHVPYCIYLALEDRKFLNIRVVRDPRTRVERVESSYVREFALEVLPPLTEKELHDLAVAQAAAGSIDTVSL